MLYNNHMVVTASYAKANLPALLKAVQRGQSISISRYNKPIAELVPPQTARKPQRKFGTLKGKIKIIDPNWARPMTASEVDAWIEGRD
jgi:prevent-host-death family protein